MPLKAIHVATGNVGRIALSQLIEDPRFDLVGLVVSDPEKVGRDAGDLAGLDVITGIAATDDLGAALQVEADCAVHCAISETRFLDAVEDLHMLLSAGLDVVSTSPVPFIYPWGLLPPAMVTRLEDLCHERGVSLFVSGIDPGWANDDLPFAVASTCQRVEKITCSEIADYASYDGGPVLFEVMGFGRGVDDLPLLFKPGMLSAAWGVSLRQLAAGFDVEIDEITEWYERVPAPEAFDVTAGHIAEGTVAAVRFTVTGMSAGRPVFVMDHITRLREDLCPDWPQPAQPGGSYRLEIEGEPSYRVDVCPSSRRGDHNYAAIAAGAGRVVNALPDVVTAPAGIRTTLDLPMPTGRGLFATTLGAAAVAEEDTPT